MCDYTSGCEENEVSTRYAKRNEYDQDSYTETPSSPKPLVLTCKSCEEEYECPDCGNSLFKRRDARTTIRNNPSHEPTTIGSEKIECIECDHTLRRGL